MSPSKNSTFKVCVSQAYMLKVTLEVRYVEQFWSSFCSVFDNGERTTEAKPIFIRFTCQPSSKPNLFHYFVFVSQYRRELDYYSFFLVKQSTKRAPPTAKSGLRVFCVTILTSVLVFMAKPSIKSGGRIDVQFHSSQPSEKR